MKEATMRLSCSEGGLVQREGSIYAYKERCDLHMNFMLICGGYHWITSKKMQYLLAHSLVP